MNGFRDENEWQRRQEQRRKERESWGAVPGALPTLDPLTYSDPKRAPTPTREQRRQADFARKRLEVFRERTAVMQLGLQLQHQRSTMPASDFARLEEKWQRQMAALNMRDRELKAQSEERCTLMGCETRALNGRVVRLVASTDAIDRHGTIVKPRGIDTQNFDRNPVLLWGHDGYGTLAGAPALESILGRVVRHEATETKFTVDAEFLPEKVNPKAERAFQMVKRGFLKGVSIGFRPKEEPGAIAEETIDGRSVPVVNKSELLEVSIVPIGSNPDALAAV